MDPFLVAHRVLPRFFVISYPFQPLSIRDQMVRGRWLIDRLQQANTIGEKNKLPVLIIGAGVAGATAALRCAERKIPAVLIDAGNQPFRKQFSTPTRWIDPAQYDWPATHWRKGGFNFASPDVPLKFKADWAHNLALNWESKLRSVVAKTPGFDFHEDTCCTGLTTHSPDRIEATIDSEMGGTFKLDCSTVIWAGGFPDETSYLDDSKGNRIFCGHPFWSEDPFGSAPWNNINRPAQDVEVAIFGGGDGALQDFLRIVTGCTSAIEFYRKLQLPAWVEQDVMSPGDHGQRNWLWGGGDGQDHSVHKLLDQTYRDAAETLLSDHGVRNQLDTHLPVNKLPRRIRLFYRCDHFNAFYGLNRFLTYLTALYLQDHNGYGAKQNKWNILNAKQSIVKIQSNDPYHTCNVVHPKGHVDCVGVSHQLYIRDDPRCDLRISKVVDPNEKHNDQANVVIIRFGFDRKTAPYYGLGAVPSVTYQAGELIEMLQRRQHSPYHFLKPTVAGSWR